MTLLLVLIGAAVGAPLRYLTDRFVQSRHDSVFPWGTWTVNVAGSLVLGGVSAAWVDGALPALLGSGFCGGLTTWSTFGYETVRLLAEGEQRRAFAYLGSSLAAGLVAAFAGAGIVSLLLAEGSPSERGRTIAGWRADRRPKTRVTGT